MPKYKVELLMDYIFPELLLDAFLCILLEVLITSLVYSALRSKIGENAGIKKVATHAVFPLTAIWCYTTGQRLADLLGRDGDFFETIMTILTVVCVITEGILLILSIEKIGKGKVTAFYAKVSNVKKNEEGKIVAEFALTDGRIISYVVKSGTYKIGQSGVVTCRGSEIVSFAVAPSFSPFESTPQRTESAKQYIKCPICETEQLAGRRICFRCGHTFTEAESSPSVTGQQKKLPETENRLCPDCGAQLQEDMRFCAHCGKAMKRENSAQQVFCHNCGKKQPYGKGKCINCGTELAKKDETKGEVQ